MTPRKLIVLTFGAIILIGLAIWFSSQRHLPRSHGLYEPLYPELASKANSITAIDIVKAGDERAVQLKRDGERWTVTERNGYTADTSKISTLLRALADAKLYEQKTANPANYALIGVEEVAAKTAKGVRVELEGLDKPLKVIVGKREPGTQSTFVRRANEPESWLVHADIDAPADPDKWLVKDVANIGADRIREADVSIDGQPPYSAVKNTKTDASFTVSPLPKGRELTSASAANGFATALMNLTLDDVKQKQAFDGKKPTARATFKTFDGLVVELDGWVDNNVHWFALKPSADADSAKKEAEDLAAKTSPWVFQAPDYKYDAIFKPLDQLLKKPEEKKPPAKTSTSSAKK